MPRIHNKHDLPERYEHWELTPPELSPRSSLYRIRPIGIGMAETECLVSYLARLASAHHLSTGDFIRRYLLPKTSGKREDTDNPSNYLRLANMYYANGMDTVAIKLIGLTEGLTLSTGLRSTTFVPWRDVVSRLELLRRFRAWCSACYANQAAGEGVVYDPLLWTVSFVKVCPTHQRPLTENCPNCEKRVCPVVRHYLPGSCPYCKTWFGARKTEASTAVIDDLDYELWVAENMGTIIAASPSLTMTPVRQNVIDALNHCCNVLMEGTPIVLARLLGAHGSSSQKWLSGKAIPPVKMLARLSYLSKVPLLKLLTDPSSVLEQISNHPVEIMGLQTNQIHHLHRQTDRSCQKVREQMEAALLEVPPPSLTEVAQRLGYLGASTLRVKFRELSKKIAVNYRTSERYRDLRSRRASAARLPDKESLKKVLEQELDQLCPASLKEIAGHLGYANPVSLNQHYPDLCSTLVEKRRQYLQLQGGARMCQYRQKLKAALREEPPPTLTAVAKHFTEIGFDFLRGHFPEECQRLIERQADYCKQRMRAAGERLRQALQENPPRSLNQLSKEIGYSRCTLSKNYPDTCSSLVNRYANYKRNLASERNR